jgi:DNA replication protein DnaC
MTNELKRYYSDLREKNNRLQRKRIEECERKSPRFAALDDERSQVFKQLSLGRLTPAAVRSRIGAIGAERSNLLIRLGLPGNYLDPIYTCPLCRDTGEITADDGTTRLCVCALKKQQERMIAGSRINDRETFAGFSEAIYPTDEQKKQGLNMKRFCERYVSALPRPEKPNLLILGPSGLGKSFFGNAIAFAAIEKGIPTLKITAYQCIQSILDGIDARENAIMPYLDAGLLVIDDLGTEPMVPNITIETFFHIMNERISSRLPTVLISNYSVDEIKETYHERVATRIIDGSLTSIVMLRGDNLHTRAR